MLLEKSMRDTIDTNIPESPTDTASTSSVQQEISNLKSQAGKLEWQT